jgi:predicted phosphohydrolase
MGTTIWGLSDLHLSFASDKPMDVFGKHWEGHADRMAAAWDAQVGEDDIVLCPGDLSWAMKLDEASLDLGWIGERPGKLKVLCRGNHDYWWSAIGKVRKALPDRVVALQNDSMDLGDVVVCGSRCWSAPGALDFGEADQKIYERELGRLRLSLESGKKLADGRPLVAAIHYPPFAADKRPTGFAELLEEYGVRLCVYGHLHGRRAHRTAVTGDVRGVHYRLIACDYLDFAPTRVWPIETGG